MIYSAAIAFTLWILFPLWFTVLSSLTSPGAIGKIPAPLWPASPTLDNFKEVFGLAGDDTASATSKLSRVVVGMGHSLMVSTVLVAIDLVIAGAAAYAISRFPFRGSRTFFGFVVISRVVPGIAIIGPFFVAFRVTNVLDHPLLALVISYNVFTLPLAIMLLKNYFDQVPREIEEAAAVDGASNLRTLLVIIAPLAVPGAVATGVLVFMEAWSELFFALTLTSDYTTPPILAGFQSLQHFNWTVLAAATVVTLIPPVVITMVFQRYVVTALTQGSGK
ncbi:carbohydrate ABC transporter permease [Dactylosporangium sp. NPDC048998]|uniref:carbohydrate ABC transporter permease n=1 Tax=Dactylosporangium sp. NPDC048998 TaxID=3363976 RepID=UPI00371709FB